MHSDIEILEGSDKWLNDKLINAGLQDVRRSNALTFEDESEESNFIQLLNCHGSQWICVTNMHCKPNVVKVCDSVHAHWRCANQHQGSHCFPTAPTTKLHLSHFPYNNSQEAQR